ncbi:hypothetical protein B4096_1808 [Heyndrickxia coagulans]|nr:hypothetical protein B4096_1808 [Heyndrickxia coagulans]
MHYKKGINFQSFIFIFVISFILTADFCFGFEANFFFYLIKFIFQCFNPLKYRLVSR